MISAAVITEPLAAADLESALAAKLRELLGEIPWLGAPRIGFKPAEFHRAFDLLVQLEVPRCLPVELWVDIRSDPRPAHFPYVSMDHEFKTPSGKAVRVPVFAAPAISPRMAEICERHGWSWFDLAGNYRISVPELLHLQHTGNPMVHRPPRPQANLGTKEAGRVVRALLSPAFAGRAWTQRSLRLECRPEVSLGLVNKVVRHLQEESFIEPLPDGGFRLSDPLKLLFAWRDSYRFEQHERQGYFSPLKAEELHAALAELGRVAEGFAAYAAFSAADFHAPPAHGGTIWLHLASHELARFQALAKAERVDSGENLVVLVPADEGVFFQLENSRKHPPLTNAVQSYVDLWHCGGAGKEAAEAILKQVLTLVWRGAGYEV